MDILAKQGELTPLEISELEAMTKDDLVALVIGMNKGWYQLLESLEDAHRQDLLSLRTQLAQQFEKALLTTRESEQSELTRLEKQLTASQKDYAAGLAVTKENGEKLSALQKVLGKYASGPRA